MQKISDNVVLRQLDGGFQIRLDIHPDLGVKGFEFMAPGLVDGDIFFSQHLSLAGRGIFPQN